MSSENFHQWSSNGSVNDFQRRLLRKEIFEAKTSSSSSNANVEEKRSSLRTSLRDELPPSVILHSRIERKERFSEGQRTQPYQETRKPDKGTRSPPAECE